MHRHTAGRTGPPARGWFPGRASPASSPGHPDNASELVILEVDPTTAYVHWYLSAEDVDTVLKMLPGQGHRTRLLLRVHRSRGDRPLGFGSRPIQETVLTRTEGGTRMHFRQPGLRLVAELGLGLSGGGFLPLVCSASVKLPSRQPARPADVPLVMDLGAELPPNPRPMPRWRPGPLTPEPGAGEADETQPVGSSSPTSPGWSPYRKA